MIERLTTIAELPTSAIEIVDRLRDVREEGVQALMEAIDQQRFGGRIVVRRTRKGDLVLDGAHRLTAKQRLGHATIPTDVVRCSDDEARMFELDGNLAGAKMTALELAYFLARRRELYQKLHPETRQGTGGATVRWNATDTMSVARVVAKERTCRRFFDTMKKGPRLNG